MEQNVGLKESNTPVENERLMQTPLYHTWLFWPRICSPGSASKTLISFQSRQFKKIPES